MRSVTFVLVMALVAVSQVPSVYAVSTQLITVLTGLNTSSGAFGVGGTDLGMPVRQPNGNIAYIFGDTFSCNGIGCGDWRSPVLLRSSAGIHLEGIR